MRLSTGVYTASRPDSGLWYRGGGDVDKLRVVQHPHITTVGFVTLAVTQENRWLRAIVGKPNA
jgi:hypothetical protein